MDRCNFSDLSIELPRCDPFSTSGGALDESTVQTFSRRVDGILNQGEHVEFKDLLPGNGACSRKSAAKTFSELLGELYVSLHKTLGLIRSCFIMEKYQLNISYSGTPL